MLGQLGFARAVLDRARRSRDARFDGKFFIAVTSTRIYCRPICPAKTSSDANVRYYATAAEAAAAGFRPCLRCRPETAPGSPAWLGTSAVVRRALRLIQEGALDENSVDELAARLGVGVRHLSRLFMRHVGASPAAIAQTRRLHFAKQLLDETELPITAIALASGFRSVRRFNDVFKAMYRRPPREIRKRGKNRGACGDAAEILLRLSYRPPYDWTQIHGFLARQAIPGLERIEADAYLRTARTARGHAVVRLSPLKQTDALELRIRGAESTDLLPLSSMVRRMFDLSADPTRITAAFQRDAHLGTRVAQHPGLRIPGVWEPFECAVRAILSHRSAASASIARLRRLVERAGQPIGDGAAGLKYLFPTAESLATAQLDDLGIPHGRAQALRCFARAICEGAICLDDSSEQVAQALASMPGIGAWGAGYVALRGLGEPDAFPSGDLILRRRASAGQSPLTAAELEACAERWRPFRGYAVFHLWESGARCARIAESFEVRRQPVAMQLPA